MVSPLIDAASVQVELVKSAKALGVPVAACIASWDNLTNKGLVRVEPDRLIVWNAFQKREAMEFHGVSESKIVTTGAQPFDRWFERQPTDTREAFCRRVGLPPDRPFVTFVGSSGFISEGMSEVAFVRRWVEALRASPFPDLRRAGVLVRPHPYNTAAWTEAVIHDLTSVVVWPKGAYNPVSASSRNTYFDSLHHSAAVVGVNTSAMIEAAIVGRPVLSVRTETFAQTQDGTLHFHYLLRENGGCVRAASSLAEHCEQLAEALRDGAEGRRESGQFVASFVRPQGVDQPSTPRVADAIEGLAREGLSDPASIPLWVYPMRLLIAAVAVGAGIYARVTSPRRWRQVRKTARSAAHRMKKRIGKMPTRIQRGYRRGMRPIGRFLRLVAGGAAAAVRWPFNVVRRVVRRGRYWVGVRLNQRNVGTKG